MKRLSIRSLCLAAIIAALYAALTLGFQAISYGPVQFRVSEALTLLPAVLPEAVPGLAVGCLISNLFNPMGATVYDVVFGTLATLLSAILTRRIRGSIWLRALPPVVCNAVIIGLVLTYAYGVDLLWMNMLSVGAGQAVVCYALGVPLVRVLEKAARHTGWK
ncbi:MAG: QueT transporter family protein [Clostridia bacterium]|nr:QueT transporter family protein [Clostridia bacterium]MDD6041115.1 QueT transporter family protein [Clostridia bacterium]